jgi:hypothetical protein
MKDQGSGDAGRDG